LRTLEIKFLGKGLGKPQERVNKFPSSGFLEWVNLFEVQN